MIGLLRNAFRMGVKSVPSHKPPMAADSPAGRYASALFSSASQKESLDVVGEDIAQLHKILEQSPGIREFLNNASFKKQSKLESLEPIKESCHELTWSFIVAMADNGRLGELHKAAEKYSEFLKVLGKEEDVRVISHRNLTDEEKARVKDSLGKRGEGALTITYEVDPAIMGGLQIFRGSTFMDCSLRSRLERIQGELAKN
ncbi:ATP synthase subunit delta-like [Hippocampus zosterae]|uniref:ATP synthase subunit delta-like n=1 Tax=Hippocampus zosterae TaxID=109293 RepID=UPI00223D5FDC|nr:ATP synthase subunit delta-like [Hippocampus zosterae]